MGPSDSIVKRRGVEHELGMEIAIEIEIEIEIDDEIEDEKGNGP